MTKPLLVDLCCGAGGCSVGYSKAGFDVIGVDVKKQKNYPFEFIQADVLDLDLNARFPTAKLFHAIPPCQIFSIATKKYRIKGKEYKDVLTPLRGRLQATGKPFIIENVIRSPLRNNVILCGEMFGLKVQRHRIFEIHGFTVLQPPHMKHRGHATGINDRHYDDIYYFTVCGNGKRAVDTLPAWSDAMGISWMTKAELTQAIPPAYTEYIGRQAILNFN